MHYFSQLILLEIDSDLNADTCYLQYLNFKAVGDGVKFKPLEHYFIYLLENVQMPNVTEQDLQTVKYLQGVKQLLRNLVHTFISFMLSNSRTTSKVKTVIVSKTPLDTIAIMLIVVSP